MNIALLKNIFYGPGSQYHTDRLKEITSYHDYVHIHRDTAEPPLTPPSEFRLAKSVVCEPITYISTTGLRSRSWQSHEWLDCMVALYYKTHSSQQENNCVAVSVNTHDLLSCEFAYCSYIISHYYAIQTVRITADPTITATYDYPNLISKGSPVSTELQILYNLSVRGTHLCKQGNYPRTS